MSQYVLILAGGKGTRFWPKSRENFPKQFLSLDGQRTFLQLTYERACQIVPAQNVYIVTAGNQVEIILEQLPFIHNSQIVIEPVGRNTCPAIALGMAFISSKDFHAEVLVMPSDQLVARERVFVELARNALNYSAQHNCFVLFGIQPDSPHTGYGYIRVFQSGDEYKQVECFVEKPDITNAENYLKQGNYYWNSGMFVFNSSVFMEELKSKLSQVYKGIVEIQKSIGATEESEVINRIYPTLEKISIDYGIMEKTQKIVLLPCDVGWNDVGSWSSIYDIMQGDDYGNIYQGKRGISIDSGRVVSFSDKLVATVGIKDVILVETDDVILLCDRSRAQDVKRIVDELGVAGLKEYL